MCEIRGVETRTPVCAVCEKYGPRNASGVLRIDVTDSDGTGHRRETGVLTSVRCERDGDLARGSAMSM